MWILLCCCGFIAGVGFAATHNPLWFAAFCPALAFAPLLANRTRKTTASLMGSAVICAALGVAVYMQSLPDSSEALISSFNNSGRLQLEATIAEEPEYGGRYTRILLGNLCVRDGARLCPVSGRVLVTSADPRQLHYGQRVLFQGKIEVPPELDGFDYPAYLALNGIYSTAFCTDLQPIDSESPNGIKSRLLTANSVLAESLARALPEPESSLAQSLLLGRRASLPDSVEEAFARTGTAHLLAISGLHLGIVVAAAIAILLAALGRRYYLYVWLGLIALWLYSLFTGMRPPVVRAAIMASTFLVAELAGRQKHAPTALALAAAVMVAAEPKLLWRTSFQLSVLAMGGLALVYPLLRLMLQTTSMKMQRRFGISLAGRDAAIDIMAATIAATVAVWPVCADTFGQMSLVGIPVSLITLPVLPFTLASAGATALLGYISTPISMPFAWLSWLCLTYVIKVISAFSAVDWATISVSPTPGWQSAVYYAGLCAAPLVMHRLRQSEPEPEIRRRQRPAGSIPSRLTLTATALILAITLVWAGVLAAPDGRLHVVFLDVGQGDSILVQTPTGRTILVDGGPDGQQTCILADKHRPFWDRSMDIIIATHAHADHLAGLLTVVNRYRTSLVLEPSLPADSTLYKEWTARMTTGSASLGHLTAGQSIVTPDGVQLEVLHPPQKLLEGTSDDLDNNGVVLRLSYGEVSFLLTADIRAEAEQYLAHRFGPRLRSQVLKVAHHGSNTSTSPLFLSLVRPQMAVVSVAAGNSYGHPHEDVLRTLQSDGIRLLSTCDCGSIEFVTDGIDLRVATERMPTEGASDGPVILPVAAP